MCPRLDDVFPCFTHFRPFITWLIPACGYTHGPDADIRSLLCYFSTLTFWGRVSHRSWSSLSQLHGLTRDLPSPLVPTPTRTGATDMFFLYSCWRSQLKTFCSIASNSPLPSISPAPSFLHLYLWTLGSVSPNRLYSKTGTILFSFVNFIHLLGLAHNDPMLLDWVEAQGFLVC